MSLTNLSFHVILQLPTTPWKKEEMLKKGVRSKRNKETVLSMKKNERKKYSMKIYIRYNYIYILYIVYDT